MNHRTKEIYRRIMVIRIEEAADAVIWVLEEHDKRFHDQPLKKKMLFDRIPEAAGAIWVDIYDRDERKDYWAPMKLIWERGFHLDRNFGDQRALPMQLWTEAPTTQETFIGMLK